MFLRMSTWIFFSSLMSALANSDPWKIGPPELRVRDPAAGNIESRCCFDLGGDGDGECFLLFCGDFDLILLLGGDLDDLILPLNGEGELLLLLLAPGDLERLPILWMERESSNADGDQRDGRDLAARDPVECSICRTTNTTTTVG